MHEDDKIMLFQPRHTLFSAFPALSSPVTCRLRRRGRPGYCRCSKPRIAVKRLMDSHCFVDAFLQLSLPSLRGR